MFIYLSMVSTVLLPDKIIKNSDNFRIKCFSYSKISAIFVFFIICFYTFLFNLGKVKTCQLTGENFVFLFKFDTCDVVYNWYISLLPPIVLDNPFG